MMSLISWVPLANMKISTLASAAALLQLCYTMPLESAVNNTANTDGGVSPAYSYIIGSLFALPYYRGGKKDYVISTSTCSCWNSDGAVFYSEASLRLYPSATSCELYKTYGCSGKPFWKTETSIDKFGYLDVNTVKSVYCCGNPT
jgi:hypothetical protein